MKVRMIPSLPLTFQLSFYLFAGSWKTINNLTLKKKKKVNKTLPPTVLLKQRTVSDSP